MTATPYSEVINNLDAAYFIKKVLSVYTHSMTTIYLSLSAQVAKSTFFMKSPVSVKKKLKTFKRIVLDTR